jgi:hypothetical protein
MIYSCARIVETRGIAMQNWQLALLIKPFGVLAFWLVAAVIARLVMRMIPDGKIKRLLSRRVGP